MTTVNKAGFDNCPKCSGGYLYWKSEWTYACSSCDHLADYHLYLMCGHIVFRKASQPVPSKARCWWCPRPGVTGNVPKDSCWNPETKEGLNA